MIKVKNLEVGDVFYTLTYDCLYNHSSDPYYNLDYPSSVKKCVIEKIIDRDAGYVIISGNSHPALYGTEFETEEEAKEHLKKLQKDFWDDYNCDEILDKLLKLKKETK